MITTEENIGFRADLHCHSTYSDGTASPHELIDEAVNIGLSGLAITDHDNTQAFSNVKSYAKEKGILLIPGVELSTMHEDVNIHILGYGYDPEHPRLKNFCEGRSAKRKERMFAFSRKLQDFGIAITEEDISLEMEKKVNSGKAWGRAHIAQMMFERGYVKNIKEAFEKYIGDKGPCYVDAKYPSVEEGIAIIRESGGLAVWAHPHFLKKEYLVREILGNDFDGLECYYGRLPRYQEEKWLLIAKQRKFLATGGSDYHGSIKPYIFLGASWVGESTFQSIYQHYLQHQKRTEH